jgi:hypothetical protein
MEGGNYKYDEKETLLLVEGSLIGTAAAGACPGGEDRAKKRKSSKAASKHKHNSKKKRTKEEQLRKWIAKKPGGERHSETHHPGEEAQQGRRCETLVWEVRFAVGRGQKHGRPSASVRRA